MLLVGAESVPNDQFAVLRRAGYVPLVTAPVKRQHFALVALEDAPLLQLKVVYRLKLLRHNMHCLNMKIYIKIRLEGDLRREVTFDVVELGPLLFQLLFEQLHLLGELLDRVAARVADYVADGRVRRLAITRRQHFDFV